MRRRRGVGIAQVNMIEPAAANFAFRTTDASGASSRRPHPWETLAGKKVAGLGVWPQQRDVGVPVAFPSGLNLCKRINPSSIVRSAGHVMNDEAQARIAGEVGT